MRHTSHIGHIGPSSAVHGLRESGRMWSHLVINRGLLNHARVTGGRRFDSRTFQSKQEHIARVVKRKDKSHELIVGSNISTAGGPPHGLAGALPVGPF